MNHNLIRGIYTSVFVLIFPIILLRLWIKGFRVKGYHKRWSERFGFSQKIISGKPIWIHAASVGEVRAAAPLIDSLLTHCSHCPIVVTTITPTGYDELKKLFGSRVNAGHLPYDIPWMVSLFLRRINPEVGVIMEREIWPNLLAVCNKRSIPLFLANARLSENSLQKYMKLSVFFRPLLKSFYAIATVSETDALRFQRLGVQKNELVVAGNLKAHSVLKKGRCAIEIKKIQALLDHKNPVWLAASTHEGEEEIVLKAHKRLAKSFPNSLLVLVPRHPERASDVYRLCRDMGLLAIKHSHGRPAEDNTQVYLVDTLGELVLFYACVNCVFVGGSLVPIGGHNVMEPILSKKPVIFGPHVWNFDDVCQSLLDADGAIKVKDASDIIETLTCLFEHRARSEHLVTNAVRVIEKHRQSLAIHMDIIFKTLNFKQSGSSQT